MAFDKPKIEWVPKEIKGDVKFREIPQEESQPVVSPGTEPPIRDNFTPEERDIIDNYLDVLDEVKDDLDYLDTEFDKKLKDIVVPYDPKKHPLLSKAHKCPYCGNPAAGNVITYDDIKKHRDGERDVNKSNMNTLAAEDFGNNTVEENAAIQEQSFEQRMGDMLKAVFNHILIIVLEFIYGIFRPLENVPGAGSIPRGIRDKINELRGQPLTNTEIEARDKALKDGSYVDELLEGYHKNVGAMKDVDSLSGIARQCVQHHRDFNNYSSNLLEKTRYAPWLALKDTNTAEKDNVSNVEELNLTSVPDGFERSSGLKFVNNSSMDYMKGRPDGNGVSPSVFTQGSIKVLNNVTSAWVNNSKRILEAWWERPETLCCFLRNVLSVGNINTTIGRFGTPLTDVTELQAKLNEGQKLLFIIRSGLSAYRVYLSLDLKSGIADMFNLIMVTVNGILTSFIGTEAKMLYSKITKGLSSGIDLNYLATSGAACLPWKEMVGIFGDFWKRLVEEFGSMLLSFFDNVRLINVKARTMAEKAELELKIDNWINILDLTIKFLRVWEFCYQTGQDPYKVIRDRQAQGSFSAAGGSNFPEEDINKSIQNLKETSTIYSEGGISGIGTPKAEEPAEDVIPYKDKVSQPWKVSEPGLRILLTNYIGLSEKDAEAVLDESGDCSCDEVMSDEELLIIRNALLKS